MILCIVQLFGGNSYAIKVAPFENDLLSTPIYFDPMKRVYYDVPVEELDEIIDSSKNPRPKVIHSS